VQHVERHNEAQPLLAAQQARHMHQQVVAQRAQRGRAQRVARVGELVGA
jgi:hypothetical protein